MFQLYRQTNKLAIDLGTVYGTNAEAIRRAASIAPSFDMPPIVDPEIAELSKVDSREVYEEDCSCLGCREYMAGVY